MAEKPECIVCEDPIEGKLYKGPYAQYCCQYCIGALAPGYRKEFKEVPNA